MSTLGVASQLAAILVPIGIAGAIIAAVFALAAGIALAFGAAGFVGGSVGGWIVGTLLSLTASFGSEWMPVLGALGALAVALALGGLIHALVIAGGGARTAFAPAEASVAPAAIPPKPRTVPVTTASVRHAAS